MMSATAKLKSVGCDMNAVFSDRSPLAGIFVPFNTSEYVVFPGFCDVHVHFREPGFSYKETIATGSAASARGGYTDVLSMPNLNPVPHNVDNMNLQREIIKRDAVIGVHPFASLTIDEKGETLSDIENLAPISIGYSDDGRGVQSESLMRSAMEKVKAKFKTTVKKYIRFPDNLSGSEYEKITGDNLDSKAIGLDYTECKPVYIDFKKTRAVAMYDRKTKLNIINPIIPLL